MKKLAFCFLIYESINHENLWNIFFQNIDKKLYTIYIHYKHDKQLKYFDSYKLNNCIETKWGDVSLVKAQNLLLEEALKDHDNSNFIFLSNSCIPLKPFEHIYNFLNPSFSCFNMGNVRSKVLKKNTDKPYIRKASQWCILNRKHSKLVLENQDYLSWFNHTIPDEHCYVSYLFKENLQSELKLTQNSAADATTFTNWHNMLYKYKNPRKGIKNYTSIEREELKFLLQSKALFGRKFNSECRFKNFYIKSISPR